MIKYPTSLPKNLQIGFDAAHPLPPLSLDDDEPLLPPGLRVNMLYSQGNESCNWQIILWLRFKDLGYRGYHTQQQKKRSKADHAIMLVTDLVASYLLI